MECNDLDYISFTNIQKMRATLLNSKVSKNIRNQGETLFCWAFGISTMLRQSLNIFIENNFNSQKKKIALKKLNSDDFHRQLRNELTMIPIPKLLSTEYNKEAPLSQAHFLFMALERVNFINKYHIIWSKLYLISYKLFIKLMMPTAFDEAGNYKNA